MLNLQSLIVNDESKPSTYELDLAHRGQLCILSIGSNGLQYTSPQLQEHVVLVVLKRQVRMHGPHRHVTPRLHLTSTGD